MIADENRQMTHLEAVVVHRSALGCLVLVASLALAACSSSSTSANSSGTPAGSTGAATTSGSPGPALRGDPVTLGVITDASGSSGSNSSMTETVNRWVSYTNNHGGVGGRPVKVIVKDSGNNAATALQAAKELVEQDH